jgi:hypothetical protein
MHRLDDMNFQDATIGQLTLMFRKYLTSIIKTNGTHLLINYKIYRMPLLLVNVNFTCNL